MVAKVLWTCVLQDQRKFRSDSVHVAPLHGNRRNHHCRDDSILRANVTRYTGVALPGCGVMVGGLGLGVAWSCWLSASPVSVSILLCSLAHWA